MSEESFYSEHPGGWIEWYCSLEDNQFLCEVDEKFIMDSFNFQDFKNDYQNFRQHNIRKSIVSEAISMILQQEIPSSIDFQNPKYIEIYQEATEMYSLFHARFIQTPLGLAMMRERYQQGKFGFCPRVFCQKSHVIPIGLCDEPKTSRVKVYCPLCKEAYIPKQKLLSLDGVAFGKSFPLLLLMTFPDIGPSKYTLRESEFQKFEPTLFGFKVSTAEGLQADESILQQVEDSENILKDLKNHDPPLQEQFQQSDKTNKIPVQEVTKQQVKSQVNNENQQNVKENKSKKQKIRI